MEQKLNLVEILKNAPEGTELYTLIYGTVKLVRVKKDGELFPITVKVLNGQELSFTKDGKYSLVSEGECILFPSRENRDWLKFKVNVFRVGDYVQSKNEGGCFKINNINEDLGIYYIGELVSDCKIQGNLTYTRDNLINGFDKIRKFDKQCLKPFDRVLVRDRDTNCWRLGIFSHFDNSSEYEFVITDNEGFKHCVPYNSETEKLFNTVDYAPEFYEDESDY